jgi:hypothetical protein
VKRKKEKHFVEPISPSQSSQRLHPGFLVEIIAVLVLAGIPFAMGKFFEFNQPDPFDSGAYAYSAWHVYQGASFGKDEIISTQPATFLVNYIGVAMFGFSELGPEIMQMILQLLALGLMFYTLRRCFGKTAAILCTAIASIYLSAPVIAKFGNVKEQFMIAFMVMAACFLILAIKTKKEWLWAITGAFAVWPYYFKPTGLSILAATGLCVVFFSLPKRSWNLFLNRLLFLSVGAIAGISPLLLFFFLKTGRPIFFQSLPLLLIQAMIASAVAGYAIVGLAETTRRRSLISRLKTVRRAYWITGAAAIVLVHIAGLIIVRIQPGAIGLDIVDYLDATPFFAVPQYIYYKISGFVYLLWMTLGTSDIYITGSRNLMGFSQQAPIVFRYYAVLKLPILMASISILVGLARLFFRHIKKLPAFESQDWMVMFLAMWWLFDMGMIWVSPRSYEQYYLPMCASAAMLGGYGIWVFMRYANPVGTLTGKILASIALLVMLGLVWPIFAGITHSPFSGQAYGQKSRGYVQTWASIWENLQKKGLGSWEQLGDYIRIHSGPEDRMYVWGWYPGMYVRAQRFSASPQAFEGNMHIVPPYHLAGIVYNLTTAFTQHPPKFIVDSRKREFPWNVPPLELWPQRPYVPKELQDKNGFLSNDPLKIAPFEKAYSIFLKQQVSPEEAERFNAMKPFRDYVMQNYKVVGIYGLHVLFERIHSAEKP